MSSSTARGAGREQGVSKWRAGTAWKQPQRLSAGRCCSSCGAGEGPVQAAGVLQEADPVKLGEALELCTGQVLWRFLLPCFTDLLFIGFCGEFCGIPFPGNPITVLTVM